MQIRKKWHAANEILFKNKTVLFLSLILGYNFSLYFSSYIDIVSMPLGSKRFLVLTLLVGLVSFFIYFLVFIWVKKQFVSLSKKVHLQLFLISFAFGPILFLQQQVSGLKKTAMLNCFCPYTDSKFLHCQEMSLMRSS